jgi:hypothetical protein
MTLKPTDDQLKTLQSVEQSSAGIDAVSDKAGGFDCVINGWLEHRVHRALGRFQETGTAGTV